MIMNNYQQMKCHLCYRSGKNCIPGTILWDDSVHAWLCPRHFNIVGYKKVIESNIYYDSWRQALAANGRPDKTLYTALRERQKHRINVFVARYNISVNQYKDFLRWIFDEKAISLADNQLNRVSSYILYSKYLQLRDTSATEIPLKTNDFNFKSLNPVLPTNMSKKNYKTSAAKRAYQRQYGATHRAANAARLRAWRAARKKTISVTVKTASRVVPPGEYSCIISDASAHASKTTGQSVIKWTLSISDLAYPDLIGQLIYLYTGYTAYPANFLWQLLISVGCTLSDNETIDSDRLLNRPCRVKIGNDKIFTNVVAILPYKS